MQQIKIQFPFVLFGARYEILQGLISLLFVTTLKFSLIVGTIPNSMVSERIPQKDYASC